jgi:hypothetical protein
LSKFRVLKINTCLSGVFLPYSSKDSEAKIKRNVTYSLSQLWCPFGAIRMSKVTQRPEYGTAHNNLEGSMSQKEIDTSAYYPAL